MSSRPVPAVPPVGSELSVAPGGRLFGSTASVPGWNDGKPFRRSSSSTMLNPASGVSLTFSMRRP